MRRIAPTKFVRHEFHGGFLNGNAAAWFQFRLNRNLARASQRDREAQPPTEDVVASAMFSTPGEAPLSDQLGGGAAREGSGRLSRPTARGEPATFAPFSLLIARGPNKSRRVTLVAGIQLERRAMNKDKIEGGVRKTAGQFEETVGRTFQDKQTTGQGLYDQAAGAAQNAYGQAKDMVNQASDNLSQTASNAQDQVASFEASLEERIKKNPLVAVGVAVGIGFVLGKIT
jgi:uncharacterized protein YjbJ (UPF0337 family)